MRIGFSEILSTFVIIFVVIFAALVFRTVRGSPGTSDKGKSSLEVSKRELEPSTGKNNQLRLIGVVFIILAVVLLLAGMDLFKWVGRLYLWFFILLVIGVVILYVSRKR